MGIEWREVDRIWAPWRMEYIKSAKDESGCVFCLIGRERDDEGRLVLQRGRYSYIVMNTYPYNNGHLVVTPYRHVPNLTDLSGEELSDAIWLVSYSIKLLRHVLNPDGFNIGANLGRVAGAGIADHVHFHIVPRWRGDTNYMTTISETRVLPEDLRVTYRKLLLGVGELGPAYR